MIKKICSNSKVIILSSVEMTQCRWFDLALPFQHNRYLDFSFIFDMYIIDDFGQALLNYSCFV